MKSLAISELISQPLRTGISRAGSSSSKQIGLTLTSVRNGRLDLSANKPIDLSPSEQAKYQVRPGAFYVVRGNGRLRLVGRGALAPDDVPMQVAFPDLLIEVVPDPSIIDPRFLAIAWNAEIVRADIEARARTSSGIHKINLANLLRIRLPVPELGRQDGIVSTYEAQIATWSRIREDSAGRARAIGILRRQILDRAFAEGVESGGTKVLGDALQSRNEIVHPRDRPSGESTFVGLEHVESETGRRIGSEAIQLENLTGRKAAFHPGDIVYGYLRPYLNKVWLADSGGYCSVDQYVFRVDPMVADAEYVAHFMRSSHYLASAPIDTTPGQLPRIRTDEVLAVAVPLPALSQQRQIAVELRRRLLAVDEANASMRAEQEAIDALPAALLRRAFEDIAA